MKNVPMEYKPPSKETREVRNPDKKVSNMSN